MNIQHSTFNIKHFCCLLFTIGYWLLAIGYSYAQQTPSQTDLQAPPKQEYKDPYLELKLELITQINKERAAEGLQPVEYDPVASFAGDLHCKEMVVKGFMAHWNTKGYKPYHRYFFAGGRDHVSENVGAISISGGTFSKNMKEIKKMLFESHKRFMDEVPPDDGHRQNVLTPGHTHVGIGLYAGSTEFRMVEEFVDRYVMMEGISDKIMSKQLPMRGKITRPGYGPYAVLVYYEPFPQELTVKKLNETSSYPDYTEEQAASAWPWDIDFDKETGGFSFTLEFADLKPGLYYLLVYVRDKVDSIPYKGGSASTEGTTPATGYVLTYTETR